MDDTQNNAGLLQRQPRCRKKRQRNRILNAVRQLFASLPDVEVLGEDRLFTALLKDSGINPPLTAPCQMLISGRPLTIVAIPDRLWIKPAPMARIANARNRMDELGRWCILVRQSTLYSGTIAEMDTAEVPASQSQ